MVAETNATVWTTEHARNVVRSLMPVEADLAFRRRCETILEFLQAGPEAQILDCGCGYGFVTNVLVRATTARVVALDSDEERLDHVRARLGSEPRVELVSGDAQALPFANTSFSHAVCSEVLEHVEDDCAAVTELFRVLQPGGRLIVTVPAAEYPLGWDPINYLLERTSGRHLGGERPWSGIWYGHRRLYCPEQLRALLAGAGFEVEHQRPLSHYCPPFAHLFLYGLLKPALQRGLLPVRIAASGDRFNSNGAVPSAGVRLAMRVLEWMDHPNDNPEIANHKRSFVAHAVSARKPG